MFSGLYWRWVNAHDNSVLVEDFGGNISQSIISFCNAPVPCQRQFCDVLTFWSTVPCPTKQFSPPNSAAWRRRASLNSSATMARSSNAFWYNFVNTGPRNSIQLSNRRVMCWKKLFLKSLPYPMKSWANLISRHAGVTSKGCRTTGSEWPDKTLFVAWPRVGIFYCVVIYPSSTMWALGRLSNGTVLPMTVVTGWGLDCSISAAVFIPQAT